MRTRKQILITGASDGIGRALALEFLKDNENDVFLVSRNKKKLQEIADITAHANDRLTIYPFDLTMGNYSILTKAVKEKMSRVDILINNAAVLVNKPFEEITEVDFDSVVSANYKVPFFLISKLISLFSDNAHIVNISSMGGMQGSVKFPGLSLYSSSKGALSILTECLAVELSNRRISVNCLALGSVQTSMFESAFPGVRARLTSESIAEYISWFSINGNKWMNGKIIPVSVSTP